MALDALTASVVAAARRYRGAVRAWKDADDRLDDLKKPATPTQKRAWRAAYRACTVADEKMWAAEKALFRAVDRLDRAQER